MMSTAVRQGYGQQQSEGRNSDLNGTESSQKSQRAAAYIPVDSEQNNWIVCSAWNTVRALCKATVCLRFAQGVPLSSKWK